MLGVGSCLCRRNHRALHKSAKHKKNASEMVRFFVFVGFHRAKDQLR